MKLTERLITSLSMQDLDPDWSRALQQSQLLNCLNKFVTKITSLLDRWPKAKAIGQQLQNISFYLIVLLFASLALPQFARDKEGLASILLAAFFVWLAGIFLAKSAKYSPNAIDALMLLFLSINIIATCASHYFLYSLHGLLKLLVYILAYFLFRALLAGNRWRQLIIVLTLLISGSLVALYGIYQYKIGVAPLATWEDPNIEDQVTRVYSTLNNPNLLAGYLVPLIMLAASLIPANWSRGKFFYSLLSAACTAILTLTLVLTGSRGGYLGAGAGFFALLLIGVSFLWRRHKSIRPLLIAALLLVPIFVVLAFHQFPGFEHRIVSIFAGREHSSNSFRLNVWHACFNMFKDNWLIGIGVGNQAFCQAYGLYMRSGFDALATYCVPLEIAVETGIFGLLSFCLIIISTLCRGHLFFWQKTEDKTSEAGILFSKWIVAGMSVALLSLCVHGLVDTVFFRPPVQFIFFLLLSLLAQSWPDQADQPSV